MVEEMRAARTTPNVAYTTFILHLDQNKEGLFCFFEGKDSGYYISRVRNIYNGNYFPIRCESKKNVLKVYSLITSHEEYDKYKLGFFVDRDFDDLLNDVRVYETPCYSIENLYTNPQVFGEILKSELGLTEVEESYNECLDLYRNLQYSFHDAVGLINGWYAWYVKKIQLLNIRREFKLGPKLPSEFVEISLNGISSNYNIENIKEKFPTQLEINSEEISSMIETHKMSNRGDIFRGKFEIQFMLTILFQLISDSKGEKRFVKQPINYGINNNLAISNFSQYAITPDCLNEYISKICN